jgi:hypothetical protein
MLFADCRRKFANSLPVGAASYPASHRSHLNVLKPKPRLNEATEKRPISQETYFYRNRLGPQVALNRTTADHLLRSLRLVSTEAWSKTESLLKPEMDRCGMEASLIDPWTIVGDTYALFELAIEHYAQNAGNSVRTLTPVVSKRCSRIRAQWSSLDARVLGFVSLHLHYTGQMLLERLPLKERSDFERYVIFLGDQLYLPLQELNQAAGDETIDPVALRAVQHLLPITTRISRRVVRRITRRHKQYQTYSGSLVSRSVQASSLRDVEIFLMYSCLSVLQGNSQMVSERLFPLCSMLYPRLHITWDLVQEMLEEITWEMHRRMVPSDMMQFSPYLRTMTLMFSEQHTIG